MTAPQTRSRQPRQMDAGALAAGDQLVPAAPGRRGQGGQDDPHSTPRRWPWFAAARLLRQAGKTGWEQADKQDVQEWMAWLLGRYSDAYASNQFRALQQFFKWLAAEEDLPDPMAGLKPPHVADKPVPVFTGQELARLERACAGRGFEQRRDAAIIAVLRASGIRLSELAGIRYDPDDPRRSDLDLWQREITVRGKGRKTRDRQDQPRRRPGPGPLPARPRPAPAGATARSCGSALNNRGPLTASGIYQVIARRGRQCGVEV